VGSDVDFRVLLALLAHVDELDGMDIDCSDWAFTAVVNCQSNFQHGG
jgi:hypothetical protein